MKKLIFLVIIVSFSFSLRAQENYKDVTSDEKIYPGGEAYEVKTYTHKFKSDKPKNVILMIGDGMGINQVFAGITANHGQLFLQNFKYSGFAKTPSSNRYITDSAAGGTALSSGKKTYNGAIGLDPDSAVVRTLLEEAEERGLSTGLVSTSAITHATPASFIAHQPNRNMYEEIAADFLNTDIDVFIGGGYKHFTDRKDGRNLVNELKNKGYKVLQDIDEIDQVTDGKLVGLTASEHMPRVSERRNTLQVAVETTIDILNKNKKGFFLMTEGSQIDWGGHQNNTVYIVEEMLDFDKAIGIALDFAAKDGETLIVVTADHETGGFNLLGGDMKTGMVKGGYSTGGHTASMVPVFAYGPGADNFTGIMENTDIHDRIKALLLGKKNGLQQ